MNLIRKYKISKIINKPIEGIDGEIISFIEDWLKDLKHFKMDDYPNSTFYMKEDGRYVLEFIQDSEYECFYVRYNDFWKILSDKFQLKYDNIQYIIKYMVETTFKNKVGIPVQEDDATKILVETTFKNTIQ